MSKDLFGEEFNWDEVDEPKKVMGEPDLVCELNFLMTGKVFGVCRIKKGSPVFVVTLKTDVGEGNCISCEKCLELVKDKPCLVNIRRTTKSETTEIYGGK